MPKLQLPKVLFGIIEQHQHQSIKKGTIFDAKLAILMHILIGFYNSQ